MINVSANASAVINGDSRRFSARFLLDGNVIGGSIKHITVNKGSCGEAEFVPGALYSSFVSAVIDYCPVALEKKELLLQFGVLVGDDYEWSDIGLFTVVNPATSAYTTSFTGIGRLSSKAGRLYVSELTYPATIKAVLNEISEQIGVTIDASEFNTSGVINTKPSGYMHREMLAYIAGIFFGYVTETADGQIRFGKFETENIVETNGDRTTQLPTFTDIETEVTGVSVTATVTGVDGTVSEEIFTSGVVSVAMENPFMTQALFDANVGNIIGFKYRSGAVPITMGDYRLEAFDCISVTDIVKNTYLVPCMHVQHVFDGGMMTYITAPTLAGEDDATQFTGSLTKRMERYEAEMVIAKEVIAKKVTADEVSAIVASFEYATIKDLNAATGRIEDLETNTLKTADLSAAVAKLGYATIDSLNTTNANVTNLQASVATIEKAYVDEAKVDTLIANKGYLTSAEIDTLVTGKGYFTEAQVETLVVNKGYLTEAQVDTLIAGKGYFTEAQIGNLLANYAKIKDIEADYVKTTTLESNYVKTATLEAEYTKTSVLEANYATIDLANVKAGSITSAMIGNGVVGTAQIADGSITDAKIVELTANKINAGTLSVERLEIRGSETSIVYALNNITDALQSQNVDTLNGEILTERTITADKIVAESITANEIAANAITANHILAGEITSDKIASSAIKAIHIEAGTITADKINLTDLFAQKITATNMTIKGTSSFEGDVTANYLKASSVDASGGFSIKDGNTVFATFGANKIELGKNSKNSVIDLCNGTGQISALDGALYGLLDGLHVGSENGLYLFGYETLLGNYYGTKTAVVHTKSHSDGDSTSVVLDAMYQVAVNNVPRASVNVYASSADTYVELLATDGTNSSALIVEPTQLLFNGNVVCDASNIEEYVALYAEPKDHTHSSLSGTATRPTYNGNDLALYSDITTAATGAYLPLSGGKMTGPISFTNNNALPSKTLQYICGIDGFADGGELGWQNKETFLADYAKTSDLANYAKTADIATTKYVGSATSSVTYHKISDFGDWGTGAWYQKGFSMIITSRAGEMIWLSVAANDSSTTARAIRLMNTYSKIANIYYSASESAIYVKAAAWCNNICAHIISNVNGDYVPTVATVSALASDVVEVNIVEFGLDSSGTVVGDSSVALALAGSATRPTYNASDLALYSDLSSYALASHTHSEYALASALSSYLPLSGGTLTGNVTIQNTNSYLGLKDTDGNIAYFQTYDDGSGNKAGFGYGWAKSLKLDGSGNVYTVGSIYEGGTALSSKYASLAHTHSEYALASHTHSGYASSSHNHDSTYAKLATANVYNGEQKFQNSSYCPTVTDTASGVGCAFKASRGMVNELLVDKLIMTASTGKIPFYTYTGTSSGSMTGLTEVASISSAGVFSGTATKATQDGNGNVITSTYAKLATYNNMMHDNNEFTFVPNAYSGDIYINYRTASGSTNGNIANYRFCNGKGSISGVSVVADQFIGVAYSATRDGSGNVITDTYATKSEVTTAVGGNYLPLSGGTVSGALTVTGGAKISGRYAGGGDDEGLVIGRASNSYAGLCLGEPSGVRSVFYLLPNNSAVWRYNNGSASYDVTHPAATGTMALKPTVLYDNSTGTYGTVTLAESAANFSMLEIIVGYSDIGGANSIKVYSPNGKVVDISTAVAGSSSSNVCRTRCTISGTSITQAYNSRLILYANATTAGVYAENILYIKTVLGYR